MSGGMQMGSKTSSTLGGEAIDNRGVRPTSSRKHSSVSSNLDARRPILTVEVSPCSLLFLSSENQLEALELITVYKERTVAEVPFTGIVEVQHSK